MKILLLDDNVECLKDLYTSLELYHQCDMFTVPEEAVASYRENQYDVVITDMKMPGLNGIEVLNQVRALNPGAKVIITTGYGDVETAITAVNHRAYAFFGKPVDFSDLMDTLGKIELETQENNKTKSEHARLALDYSRLKQAYQDLQELLRKRMD